MSTCHVIPQSPISETEKSPELVSDSTLAKPVKAVSKEKPRRPCNLPLETVEYLKAWMMSPEHIAHPYPTEQEKQEIMANTGIELKQLTNWFVNNRKRYWKPLVEAKFQQQQQQQINSLGLAPPHNNKNLFPAGIIPYTASPSMFSFAASKIQFDKIVTPSQSVTNDNSSNNNTPIAPQKVPSEECKKLVPSRFEIPMNYVPHSSTSLVSESSLDTNDAYNYEETESMSGAPLIENLGDTKFMKSTSSSSCAQLDAIVESISLDSGITLKKRRIQEDESQDSNKEARVFRSNFTSEKWREACIQADDVDDECLPSLDEAVQLFGYSKS